MSADTIQGITLSKDLTELDVEALTQFMEMQGFSPDAGGMLILPEHYRDYFTNHNLPEFIKFSSLASKITLINKKGITT